MTRKPVKIVLPWLVFALVLTPIMTVLFTEKPADAG